MNPEWTGASVAAYRVAGPSARTSKVLDIVIAAGLFGAAVAFVFALNRRLDQGLYRPFSENAWFQADTARTLGDMVERGANHYRSKVHPIFTLIAFSFIALLRPVWPGTPLEAAVHAQALVAGGWVVSLYALCRSLRAALLHAAVLAVFGLSCSAFIYFFAVPETYGWGSLSILVVLLIAARVEASEISDRTMIAASAASLAFTITNWMAGLALVAVLRSRRSAVRLSLIALAVVMVLAIVQKAAFPTAELFFLGSSEELSYVNPRDAGGPAQRLSVLLLHSVSMPAQLTLPPEAPPFWSMLSVQHAVPGSGPAYSGVSVALWIVLLGLGVYAIVNAVRSGVFRRYAIVAGLVLGGQIALHLVYGEESFLYVLHVLAPLLGVVALSLHTRLRWFATAIAVVLTLLNFTNNLKAFAYSEAHVLANLTQRQQVQRAMRQRPKDAWPRGQGHVVLGPPGGALETKAYHEPGASLSPSPSSFGVSVWVTDAAGKLRATSDTIDLAKIRQNFGVVSSEGVASIDTSTPFYVASWGYDAGRWELSIRPAERTNGERLWIVVRSVGPAGGPIRSASWSGATLDVNQSWRLTLTGGPERTLVASENLNGVQLQPDVPAQFEDASGWQYAAALLPANGSAHLNIARSEAAPNPGGPILQPSAAAFQPRLPDAAFVASANAQQAHLLMGLTNSETRPGEPINYDFEWLRDAAYVTVALARAGQTAIAEQLAQKLAKQDFYGGFGAEGDAPGLALWALGEVAEILGSSDFDAQHWPDVERKVAWIEACLTAKEGRMGTPIGPTVAGSKWPAINRVCERARAGLIVGQMDHHHPVLFVNAVSYAGLRSASRWAMRLGQEQRARALSKVAERIAAAWRELFLQSPNRRTTDALRTLPEAWPELQRDRKAGLKREYTILRDWRSASSDPRTRIAGLWPSWIVASDENLKHEYERALDRAWTDSTSKSGAFKERPEWTYFTFAEAHQWLLLGRSDRAWDVLRWFFEHSASPGLYSWWEGYGEENTSQRWESIRGWVTPTGVTPHYWTAAEALLLQIGVCAYVDESVANRPIVIGAGIPASWLTHELSTGRIATVRGPIEWKWRTGVLEVHMRDESIPLVLGPAFAQAKLVRVTLP